MLLWIICYFSPWRSKTWKGKWRCHRMPLLHARQWQSYSCFLQCPLQAVQLVGSEAHSHLVFSASSSIRSCIQFGTAGAFHWAPECLAKVLEKKENRSSLKQSWTPVAKILKSLPLFCTSIYKALQGLHFQRQMFRVFHKLGPTKGPNLGTPH